MKIWISIVVTTAGFFLGLVLAGVGGLSAETFFKSQIENNKKIENYWVETGLNDTDVFSLISNSKCGSSGKYYQACLNAVLQNRKSGIDQADLSEKTLLQRFLANPAQVDFEKEMSRLFRSEPGSRQAALAARLINSFLSVYADPHTYIMPSRYFKEVSSKIERSRFFVGISYERRGGEFFVRKVSKNSDAELAGLKTKDRIVSINGLKLRGMSYDDVGNLLKDEKAKSLGFQIVRHGKTQQLDVVRSFRYLSHVQYNLLQAQKNFGLITLSKFNKGACREVEGILKKSKKDKVDGIILDLRDNPGGFLDEAACITGLFIGRNKKAYYVEYMDPVKPNEVVLTSELQQYRGPMVVLVNSSSASASESFAGAMQDYRRAVVIGERTFGKGTFQEPEEWLLNAKISLFKTQGFYLLPSRNSTQIVGVKPNIEIAETLPAKREDSFFFNPLHKSTHKYRPLKNSEVTRYHEYSKCGSNSEIQNEDIYLEKSLAVLTCANEKGIAVAQSYKENLN